MRKKYRSFNVPTETRIRNRRAPLESYFYAFPKESILSYVEIAQSGVRGIVTDENGEPLADANIEISGIYYYYKKKNITTSALGEYWRLLAPGNYW